MKLRQPAFKVKVTKRCRGKWKFVVCDYVGAYVGQGERRTQELAKKAGMALKRATIEKYPGLRPIGK